MQGSEQKQASYIKQAAASKQQQTSSIKETTTNPGCTAKDTHHTTTTFENFETTKNETRGTPGVLKL